MLRATARWVSAKVVVAVIQSDAGGTSGIVGSPYSLQFLERFLTDDSIRVRLGKEEVRPFVLQDGDHSITVRLPQGEVHDKIGLDTDYETGSRRHSAEILPVDIAVSALGVKLEDGTFGPLREVPLPKRSNVWGHGA